MREASEQLFIVVFWAMVIVIIALLAYGIYKVRRDKAKLEQKKNALYISPIPEVIKKPPVIDGSEWRGDPPKYFPGAKWNEFADDPDYSLGYKAMGMEYMLDRENGGIYTGDEFDHRHDTSGTDDDMPEQWRSIDVVHDYERPITIDPGLSTFDAEAYS